MGRTSRAGASTGVRGDSVAATATGVVGSSVDDVPSETISPGTQSGRDASRAGSQTTLYLSVEDDEEDEEASGADA